MAVMQGTFVQKYINLKNSDGTPIDITGWTFRSTLRRAVSDPVSLAVLDSAGGGFAIIDAVNGRLAIVLDDLVTALLPVGRVHFDVLHDNAPSGPVWMFGGSFIVKQPVTR